MGVVVITGRGERIDTLRFSKNRKVKKVLREPENRVLTHGLSTISRSYLRTLENGE